MQANVIFQIGAAVLGWWRFCGERLKYEKIVLKQISTMPEMTDLRERLEIEGRPLRPTALAVFLAIAAVLIGGAALGFYHTDRIHNASDRVIAGIIAAAFAAFSIGLLRKTIALIGKTVVISADGFVDRRLSTEMIPWRAVVQLDALRMKRLTYLAFRLSRDFQDQADRRAMRSVLFRFKTRFRPQGLHLMFARDLGIKAGDLVQAMTSRRNAAIGQMPEVDRAAMIQRREDASAGILLGLKNKRPYLSFALLTVLVAIYAVEIALTGSDGTIGHHFGEMTPRSLVLDGGMSRPLIASGQYWRFFTAPLLHLNPLHLLGNGVALIFSGYLLERLIGWRWYGSIFAISALVGGVASYVWNPVGVVSAGASGGIVGLFAAALVVAFHYPSGALRTAMTIGAMRVLLPTLLPFLQGRSSGPVDVAVHVGGAIGGALIGLILLKQWTDDQPPRRSVFAGIVTASFVVCAMTSFALAARDRQIALAFDLHLPRDFQQQVLQSAALIKTYPRDPRIRYARAAALYDDDHNQEAKTLLEETLADRATLNVAPAMEAPVRRLLSMIDEADGDLVAAKAAVAPLCGPTNTAFGGAKASICSK